MLLPLGNGDAGVARLQSDVRPLLRRGWVSVEDSGSSHYHGFVRITPDGLRALALGMEKFGLPELESPMIERRVCADCENVWHGRCAHCGGSRWRDQREE
jgi:hypothetical protein